LRNPKQQLAAIAGAEQGQTMHHPFLAPSKLPIPMADIYPATPRGSDIANACPPPPAIEIAAAKIASISSQSHLTPHHYYFPGKNPRENPLTRHGATPPHPTPPHGLSSFSRAKCSVQ